MEQSDQPNNLRPISFYVHKTTPQVMLLSWSTIISNSKNHLIIFTTTIPSIPSSSHKTTQTKRQQTKQHKQDKQQQQTTPNSKPAIFPLNRVTLPPILPHNHPQHQESTCISQDGLTKVSRPPPHHSLNPHHIILSQSSAQTGLPSPQWCGTNDVEFAET